MPGPRKAFLAESLFLLCQWCAFICLLLGGRLCRRHAVVRRTQPGEKTPVCRHHPVANRVAELWRHTLSARVPQNSSWSSLSTAWATRLSRLSQICSNAAFERNVERGSSISLALQECS